MHKQRRKKGKTRGKMGIRT